MLLVLILESLCYFRENVETEVCQESREQVSESPHDTCTFSKQGFI